MTHSSTDDLDYLLYILSLAEGKLKGIWKRAARTIMSSMIRKELIGETGFEAVIKKGIEENFLTQQDEVIFLSPNGRTYIQNRLPKLRFAEEIRYQIDRLRDLGDDEERRSYIEDLTQELENMLEYASKGRESPLPDNITVNGFLGEIGGRTWLLSATSTEYVNKQNFSAKGLLLKTLEEKLQKLGFEPICRLGYSGITLFFNFEPTLEALKAVEREGYTITNKVRPSELGSLDAADFIFLLSRLVSDHLSDSGLTKIGQRLKFIDFSAREFKKVRIGRYSAILTIYHGLNIEVQRVTANQFLLWMDPTYMRFYTLNNWIEAEGADSNAEIRDKMQSICTLPYKRECSMVKLDLQEKIPSEMEEYWRKKYDLELTTKKGVAEVRFEDDRTGKNYSYPLETLCLHKKWIEENIGYIIMEYPALSPAERKQEMDAYFERFIRSGIETAFGTILFRDEVVYLNEITSIFKESYRLLPPILSFSKKDISRQSTDTRAIFRNGGYAGSKAIHIFRVICPSTISSGDVFEFLNSVKKAYDDIFGRLEYPQEADLRVTHSERLLFDGTLRIREVIKGKLESISIKTDASMQMVVVVDPNQEHVIHYITKGLINDCWRVPDQHVKEKTFERVRGRDLPTARGISLQLYVKSLKPHEPPWILRYPSDESGTTVYCGIGYSMRTENSELKKSIGILAICDAQGKYIYQHKTTLSKVTGYLSKEILQKVFSFIEEKTSNIPFNRLVIYRREHLSFKEKDIAQEFIRDMKKTDFWKEKVADVVSVEEGLHRFFKLRNSEVSNVDPGTMTILNEREALTCVSGHPELGVKQGTARLLHILMEIDGSKKGIKDIVREYYDRTFLNWMAPVTLSKYPPELNIAQNIAEITREVDIKEEFTYLVV